jgi:hypothetical protein
MIQCTMQRRNVPIEQEKEPRVYKVVREYYVVAWDEEEAARMVDDIGECDEQMSVYIDTYLRCSTSLPQEVSLEIDGVDADYLGEVISKMKKEKEK